MGDAQVQSMSSGELYERFYRASQAVGQARQAFEGAQRFAVSIEAEIARRDAALKKEE